jgi:hypothetical protein
LIWIECLWICGSLNFCTWTKCMNIYAVPVGGA